MYACVPLGPRAPYCIVLPAVLAWWAGGGSLWVTSMHVLHLWEPVTMHLGWWSIQWYLCSQLCVWVYMGLCVLWVYCYMSVYVHLNLDAASGAQSGRPEVVLMGGSLRLTRSLHTPAQVVTVGLYDLLSPFSSGVVSQTGFLMCSGNCSNLV